ncbi:MAG: hypothetical protein AAF587_20325 [Bacteroidota bacterium]
MVLLSFGSVMSWLRYSLCLFLCLGLLVGSGYGQRKIVISYQFVDGEGNKSTEQSEEIYISKEKIQLKGTEIPIRDGSIYLYDNSDIDKIKCSLFAKPSEKSILIEKSIFVGNGNFLDFQLTGTGAISTKRNRQQRFKITQNGKSFHDFSISNNGKGALVFDFQYEKYQAADLVFTGATRGSLLYTIRFFKLEHDEIKKLGDSPNGIHDLIALMDDYQQFWQLQRGSPDPQSQQILESLILIKEQIIKWEDSYRKKAIERSSFQPLVEYISRFGKISGGGADLDKYKDTALAVVKQEDVSTWGYLDKNSLDQLINYKHNFCDTLAKYGYNCQYKTAVNNRIKALREAEAHKTFCESLCEVIRSETSNIEAKKTACEELGSQCPDQDCDGELKEMCDKLKKPPKKQTTKGCEREIDSFASRWGQAKSKYPLDSVEMDLLLGDISSLLEKNVNSSCKENLQALQARIIPYTRDIVISAHRRISQTSNAGGRTEFVANVESGKEIRLLGVFDPSLDSSASRVALDTAGLDSTGRLTFSVNFNSERVHVFLGAINGDMDTITFFRMAFEAIMLTDSSDLYILLRNGVPPYHLIFEKEGEKRYYPLIPKDSIAIFQEKKLSQDMKGTYNLYVQSGLELSNEPISTYTISRPWNNWWILWWPLIIGLSVFIYRRNNPLKG